jgi:hypothetical protein
MDTVILKSPNSDETKEVEATAAALSPLLAKGWHQVPAPANQAPAAPAIPAQEEK